MKEKGIGTTEILAFIVGFIMVIAGIYGLYSNIKTYFSSPKTRGTVISSQLIGGNKSKKNKKSYYTEIKCKYKVNGKSYTSRDKKSFKSRDKASKYVKIYPAGKKVNIYYNKSNPARGTMYPLKSSYTCLVILLLGVSIIVGTVKKLN